MRCANFSLISFVSSQSDGGSTALLIVLLRPIHKYRISSFSFFIVFSLKSLVNQIKIYYSFCIYRYKVKIFHYQAVFRRHRRRFRRSNGHPLFRIEGNLVKYTRVQIRVYIRCIVYRLSSSPSFLFSLLLTFLIHDDLGRGWGRLGLRGA